MPQGGIYYTDPQPTQRVPTAPIQAQGNQPPFAGQRLAQTMALVLASWPTGMEPGLPVVPQRQYIAPLTLKYGQQPPLSSGYNRVHRTTVFNSWPSTYDQWLPQRDRERKNIAPLISLIPVPQPAPNMTGFMMQVLASWPADADAGAWVYPTRSSQFAPLTLLVQRVPYVASWQQVVLASWQPVELQYQRDRKTFAPLTITYGQQPPQRDRRSINSLMSIIAASDPASPQFQLRRFTPKPPLSFTSHGLLMRRRRNPG